MLIELWVTAQCQEGSGKSPCFSDKPVVGEGEKITVGQLVCDSAENSASPLCNFLVFGEESWLENLKEEEAHVILFGHLLHDEINLAEPLLHEPFDLAEIALDALDEDVGQILIVVFEEGDGLSANIFRIFLL